MSQLRDEELRVLEEVRTKARISIRELAANVGLPETTARDILHRLERNGVILGYRAVIDPKSIGANVRHWLVCRVPSDAAQTTLAKILAEPGVERAHLLPDRPDCVAVWLSAPDSNAMAVKLGQWAKMGVRVEESFALCELEEPVRADVREESPDHWFGILKETA